MNSKWTMRYGALVCVVAGLVGCSRAGGADNPAAPAAAATKQYLTVSIDGKPCPIDPDTPATGNTVTLGVTQDADNNTVIGLGIGDQTHDYALAFWVTTAKLAPGTYEAYGCGFDALCGKDNTSTSGAVIAPFAPDAQQAMTDTKEAYKYPALGLVPLTLTIEKIEDAEVDGIGPTKRIKGRFKGDLAQLREVDRKVSVVGPLKHVEGEFDLYADLH